MGCESVKDPKKRKQCEEANKQLARFQKTQSASKANESTPMKNRAIETIADKMVRQAKGAMKPKYNK
tara:strand:+ start:4512 stop:4712 length:201 start_codon:yes stop_codon:yes gene_type:complete